MAENITEDPNIVSMRALSRHLGVTLRAVQLAEIDGRIKPIRRIAHGKLTRVFFDLKKSTIDFESSRHSNQPLATRREQGKGPQPMFNSSDERETPEGQHTHEAAVHAKWALDHGEEVKPPISEGEERKPVESQYSKLKMAKEALQLQSARLDMDERQGKLVNTEEAKLLFFQLANITMQNLLNVPDRIAPLIAAETDQRRCREIVMVEIKQALAKISDGTLQFKTA